MYIICRHVDELIMNIILDVLPYFIQLEVNCFSFIGHISGDKGKVQKDIVDDTFNTVPGSCWGGLLK